MSIWDAHCARACDLALLLAVAAAPEDVEDRQMVHGFLLHDIGKRVLPDAILNKPGPLDDEEHAIVRTHPQAGWRMLNEVEFGARTRDVVLYHHEHWDGSGYPLGLSGERIPLWARIVAIADAVDAMTSDRPYRRAMTLQAALDELRAQSGRQFDPALVELFLGLDRERLGRYTADAARSVASKSVFGMGPTHGELVPAAA